MILFFSILFVWLMIGVITGRLLFAAILGDKPRQVNKYANASKHSLYYGDDQMEPTPEFESAFRYAMYSVLFWPVTLTLYGMQAATPIERQRKAEERAKELSERIAELDQEYQQFVKRTNK